MHSQFWLCLVWPCPLPPEPGFTLERDSGHLAQGCIGADVTGRVDQVRTGDREACISLR